MESRQNKRLEPNGRALPGMIDLQKRQREQYSVIESSTVTPETTKDFHRRTQQQRRSIKCEKKHQIKYGEATRLHQQHKENKHDTNVEVKTHQ